MRCVVDKTFLRGAAGLLGAQRAALSSGAGGSGVGGAPTSLDKSSNLASVKRGSGGRSSFSGNVVTVLGATGMVGRIVANRLGKEGSQIIVGYRGDPWDARSLKMVGDLGQVLFQEVDIKDPEKIRRAVQYSNIVVNCIGSEYETSNFSFEDVHVTGPRNIARIARECGVEKLVHFSALNASPNPQKIFGAEPSRFLISKYEGEKAVRDEFADAVIIRPSDIYGESDRFLFYYASRVRRGLESIQLWKRGEKTIKMPVHQSNVADGVMKILHNRDIKGVTYDFVGPDSYLLSEIVDYIFQLLRRTNIERIGLTPTRIGFTYLMDKVLKRPKYSLDRLEREFISDTLSTDTVNPTLADLGVQFLAFDQYVPWDLRVYNKYSYYDEKLGEFPDPKPPVSLSVDFEYQLRRNIRHGF